MPIVLSQIEALIQEKQLKKANNLLQQYFRENGIDSQGQKIYLKLKQAIQNYNQEIGNFTIQEISQLIKKEDFNGALQKLNQSKQYLEKDPKFQKFYLKTIQQIHKQNNLQYQKFIKLETKKLKKLIQANQENEALSEIQGLCAKHPNNASLKILLQETKVQIIDHKIKKNRKQLESSKPKDQLEFYKKLYQIDPKHPKIKIGLSKAKKALDQEGYFQKDQYLQESEMQIKILFNTQKYQKCNLACIELLRFDTNNKLAQKYFKKSRHGLQKQNLGIAYQKLQSHLIQKA